MLRLYESNNKRNTYNFVILQGVRCKGACPCNDDCNPTDEFNPVCGYDRKTYYNPSSAKCANQVSHKNYFCIWSTAIGEL